MNWLTDWGAFAGTALVIFVPGALAALVLGMRGFGALAAAAPLSLAVIGTASLVDAVVPFRWGALAWALSAALFIALAAVVRLLQRRWNGPWREQAPSRSWQTWLPFVAVAVAVAVAVPRILYVLGDPQNISQTFDNVYHINAVRYILDNGHISPTRQLLPGFYPALWHATTATVVQVSGAAIPGAINAVSVVLAAVVWPIACVYLVRQIVGSNTAALLVAGAMSVGLGSFPLLMLDFGVLYPNVLSIALLPSVLAALVAVTGLGDGERPPLLTRWVLLFAYIAIVALAHPSTLMAFFAIGIWPAAYAGVRWFRTARERDIPRRGVVWAALAWIGGLAVASVMLLVLRPTSAQAFWGPSRTLSQAVIEVVTNGTVGRSWEWAVSILVIVGIVAILGWQRRRWWLVAGWATIAVLYIVCATVPHGMLRYGLTGTWYSDLFRIAALLPAVVIPLAAVGLAAVVGLLPHPRWRVVAGAAGAAVVLVATQFGPAMKSETAYAHWIYQIGPDSPLLNTSERALIMRLPREVPRADTIVGSPWTGTSLSYALADRKALVPHIYQVMSPDMTTIATRLNQADSDPAVCAALRRTGTRWVLDFGAREVQNGDHAFPGLEGIATSGVVRLVDSEGPDAKLYRITACGL